MVQEKSVTLEQVLQKYAQHLGKKTLSDGEKKQAVMEAKLHNKRIEPFATFIDIARYMSDIERETWIMLLEWER